MGVRFRTMWFWVHLQISRLLRARSSLTFWTIECGFTLKRVRDMRKTYTYILHVIFSRCSFRFNFLICWYILIRRVWSYDLFSNHPDENAKTNKKLQTCYFIAVNKCLSVKFCILSTWLKSSWKPFEVYLQDESD